MAGFSIKNQESISPTYGCHACNLILRDPYQLNCGHRQCKSCIDSVQGGVVRCSECNEETNKVDILPDRGCRNDLKRLPIVCSYCEWNSLLKDYEDHLAAMHANPVCEVCGTMFGSTDQLEVHKQREHREAPVPCQLREYGCSDAVAHAEMHQHCPTFVDQNAARHEESRGTANRVPPIFLSNTTAAAYQTITAPTAEISETLHVLAEAIRTLNDDVQRLRSDSIRSQNSIGSLEQDFAALQMGIQERNALLQGIRLNQEILHQELASLQQKLDDLQYATYDGTLIWRITDVREKMGKWPVPYVTKLLHLADHLENARAERPRSIYSPPFYSSLTGYKMRAQLYLNGDGDAKGNHMSLFFVLMRGPNDAMLRFPFNYKVAFCLYDQTDPQRHFIDSFRPDIGSDSFQRPQFEMNLASGIPKFFPLTMIRQDSNPYVQDDTMFIKIMVDFENLSSSTLQYAFGLNPGLPPQIRYKMIQQESERRPQETEQQNVPVANMSVPLAGNSVLDEPIVFSTTVILAE